MCGALAPEYERWIIGGVRLIFISGMSLLRPPVLFRYLFVNLPKRAWRVERCGGEASTPWTLALPPASPKMKKAQLTRQLFTHPSEFRSLVQYWLWHEPKRDITALGEHETSGYNRKSMKRCWEFLDQTSRSFAAVIKELDGDLARVVWPFLRKLLHELNAFCSVGVLILPCAERARHP